MSDPSLTSARSRLDARTRQLEALVRERISDKDPSHDWSHVQRVVRNAIRLCDGSPAQLDIVVAAALLHDLVNLPKHHEDRREASRRSAAMAVELLAECGYTDNETKLIRTAIEEHSYSLKMAPSTEASALLQDADRLDALGAIGIFRAATCGTLMGATYYNPEDPFATGRPLDDKHYTLDHFFTKLLLLEQGFNTQAGRTEARKRTAFMRSFLAELSREIGDDRDSPPAA
ncbi:HD domain-containing protein [Aquabacterium sp. A7-Y]|uniref:HD domain-containing protein n=1 Tax=Aquabacterium sp. A7-Y TaxID=1349605 RepID=UPI00223E8850|nr:HD domain-containing protein [Aquabacterium sp. A7-Y]MCW7538537.1 HD domain-containing protein [Aquabacterium sp. A7-Y]